MPSLGNKVRALTWGLEDKVEERARPLLYKISAGYYSKHFVHIAHFIILTTEEETKVEGGWVTGPRS